MPFFCCSERRKESKKEPDSRPRTKLLSESPFYSFSFRSCEEEGAWLIGEGEICSICLQPYQGEEVLMLPCLHSFHSECICQWAHRQMICPLCRETLVAKQ